MIAGIRHTALMTVAVALAGSLAVGCSSHTAYKHARPMGPGKTRVMVAPQVHTAASEDGATVPYPELAIAVRRGMTESVDLGGSVGMLSLGRAYTSLALEGSGQYHLYRSPSGRVELAVGAGLGYRATMTTGAAFETIHVSLPLVVGINLGAHQLVLSPHTSWQRWYSEGTDPVDISALGASIGFYWQISRRFALHPELSFAGSNITLNDKGKTTLGHFGIALVFGR